MKYIVLAIILTLPVISYSWGTCIWVSDGQGTKTQICAIW